jgi:hypothetical protein
MGWTDCDQSLSLGTVLKGTSWGRPNDRIGAAGVIEGLSAQTRAYFAPGGLGILIGDGQLNYRQEKIFEAYYAYGLDRWMSLNLRLSVHRESGLQRRPRAGLNLCPEVPCGVLVYSRLPRVRVYSLHRSDFTYGRPYDRYGSVASHPDLRDAPAMSAMPPNSGPIGASQRSVAMCH